MEDIRVKRVLDLEERDEVAAVIVEEGHGWVEGKAAGAMQAKVRLEHLDCGWDVGDSQVDVIQGHAAGVASSSPYLLTAQSFEALREAFVNMSRRRGTVSKSGTDLCL